MARPAPRAVLLDCLGTLLRLEPPGPRLRTELAARGIDVTEDQAAAAFGAEIDYYLEHHLEGSDEEGLSRLRDACARVVGEELGLAAGRFAVVREAMLGALRFSPYRDVFTALPALRDAGMSLVVVSNWDCSLERTLRESGVGRLVDVVITSARVAAAKPDPAIFHTALEAVGRPAGEAICIGDSLERDVGGARAAGVPAILLRRNGGSRHAHVPVVRSLDEARSLILTGP